MVALRSNFSTVGRRGAFFLSPQVGDFGVLWRCGLEFGLPTDRWLESCHGGYILAPQLFRERSFFYTVPFSLIFGANYTALKIYNAMLHASTAVLLLICCNRDFGPRAGFMAVTFMAAQPEWWFAIPLASMDNVALLAIIALIWGLRAVGDITRPLLASVALASVAVVLEWSRSMGGLVLITILTVMVVNIDRTTWRNRLLSAATIAIVYVLINRGLNALLGAQPSPDPLTQSLFALDMRIRPPQNYQVLFEWTQHLWTAISPEHRFWFGLHRFIDEMAHGFFLWPGYMAEKAAVLFASDGYLYFATVNWPDNRDTVFTVAQSNVPHGAATTLIVRALAIVNVTIAAFAVVWMRRTGLTFAALAFLGTFMAAIVGIGPLLSRYGLLVAPALAIIVGGLVKTRGKPPVEGNRGPYVTVLGLGQLAAAFLVGTLPALLYQERNPRSLMTMTQESPSDTADIPCNTKSVPIWAFFNRRMRSNLGPDVTCVSYRIPVLGRSNKLSFFVTRERLPYLHDKLPPVSFEYAFRIGQSPLAWESLDDASVRWHEIQVPFDPKGAIMQLIVRRTRPGAEIQFEIRDLLIQPL
jgi:hypothetical protein